jgi:hypothetical protein
MHSRCSRCGAPAEPRQEVCLQCGAPLSRATPTALERLLGRRLPWLPGDLFLPMVALAAVTLASAAVALGARHERRDAAPSLVPGTPATSATTTVAPTSMPVTTPTAPPATTTTPGPTISDAPLPAAPGAPSTVTRTTPPPARTTPTTTGPAVPQTPAHTVGSWPAGASGWTDIIESLPASSGRAAAVVTARKALKAGLTHVGVLLSSDFSSLRSGYWVVYAGAFGSSSAAEGGLATTAAHGFVGAYPARISR